MLGYTLVRSFVIKLIRNNNANILKYWNIYAFVHNKKLIIRYNKRDIGADRLSDSYNINDTYIWLNEDNKIESFNTLDVLDSTTCIDFLTEFIIDNPLSWFDNFFISPNDLLNYPLD